MATLNGTPGDDTVQGTAQDDSITASAGNDLVSGEGANDSISGGAGNDTVFGDAGVGTAPGLNATPITLSFANRVADTGNTAEPGDVAIYRNVAQLEDGTQISGRLVLVSTSSADLNVDLTGGTGFEILLNSGRGASATQGGETATFRLEFFDPATGASVALNSTGTFNDLDRNSVGDQESVTIDAGSFTKFGTSNDTSLAVTTGNGTVIAAGTETNNPFDQDAWFSAQFENREFIEFTLETRSTQSGFTLSGDLIDEGVVTPIEAGDDTIDGGPGNDVILGQGGNTIDGGPGNDVILGQGGNDVLDGGAGSDSIDGGEGRDTITVGGENDTVTGGPSSDLFSFSAPGSHTIRGGEDANGSDVDVLDLTGLDRSLYTLTEGAPEAGTIAFRNANGAVIGTTTYSEIEEVIICFTPGTRIATRRGQVRVQQLKVGDEVLTRDNGAQAVRWVGRRNLGSGDLCRTPAHLPVRIKAGALGGDTPVRDTLVSPNHRMLIASEHVEVMFGEREVLVAAKHLTALDGVDVMPVTSVSYLHLMFDAHEVILADGVWTESFQPGDYTMAGILSPQRAEILSLFPDLIGPDNAQARFPAARRLLRAHEAHVLASEGRHG